MSGRFYSANFDDTEFNKFKNNEFNRLNEDACYTQQKETSNNKKLKFVTTNHIDLLNAKDELNFFGIGIRDQLFVPSDKIDTYSSLVNGSTGQTITNNNMRNNLTALPLATLPYRGQLQHGDVDIEDSIRNNLVTKKNSIIPRDSEFERRSFTIFNDEENIPIPQAIFSVETPADGFEFGRNGVSGRFTKRFDNIAYTSAGTDFTPFNQ